MIKGTDKKCCVFGKKKGYIIKSRDQFSVCRNDHCLWMVGRHLTRQKKTVNSTLVQSSAHSLRATGKVQLNLPCLLSAAYKRPSKKFPPPLPIRARSLLQNRRMTHEHGNEWGTQTQMKWGKCSEAEEGYVLLNASANKPKTITSSYFFFLKRDRESTVSELHHYFFTT